jgi:tetratricopeptide (TPR) repeat protein
MEIVNSIPPGAEQDLVIDALVRVLAADGETARALELARRSSWQANLLIEAARLSAAPGVFLEATLEQCRDVSEDYPRRALTLSLIPHLPRAGELAASVEAGMAALLKKTLDPADALSELAAGLAKAGRHESARSAAAEAIESIGRLEEHSRRGTMDKLLRELALSGMAEEALRLARLRPTPDERFNALIGLFPNLAAAGRSAEARDAGMEAYETAVGFDNEYSRHSAVYRITQAFVSAGMTEDALVVARRGGGKSLIDAVTMMAQAGQADTARQAASEARAEARQLSDVEAARSQVIAATRALAADAVQHDFAGAESVIERIHIQIGVALGLASRFQGADATAAIRQAVLFANDITDAPERTAALRGIASELVQSGITAPVPEREEEFPEIYSDALMSSGKLALALSAAQHAGKTARLELFLRAVPLLMASGQAKRGRELASEVLAARDNGLVSAHVKPILNLKLEIDHPAWCTALVEAGRTEEALAIAREPATLQAVAQALVWAGKHSEALEAARRLAALDRSGLPEIAGAMIHAGTFEAALEISRLVEDVGRRSQLIAEIARAMAIKADPKVLDVAREIEDMGERVNALALASRTLHDQQLLDETCALVEKIGTYDGRARACARIAVAWAEFGLFQKSRETAERCYLPQEKLWACTAMVRNYVVRQKPELAGSLTEAIRPNCDTKADRMIFARVPPFSCSAVYNLANHGNFPGNTRWRI